MSREDVTEIKGLLETVIQQKSASDSDVKKQLIETKEHLKTIDDTLNRIETQTMKTNGRVTKLEQESNTNKGWIRGIGLAGGVIVVLVGVVYTLTVKVLQAQIDNIKQVQK